MKKPVTLLAWWFLAWGSAYAGIAQPVGPFRNQQECDQVRQHVEADRSFKYPRLTWCWWDGKP